MRPGVNITTRENALPPSVPTDVGTCFMIGVTESGPLTLTSQDVVTNMDEYTDKWAYTGRAYANAVTMYDSAELFFREGGSRLFVGRVVGAAAVVATIAVQDASAATVWTANAKGPGDWGNDLNVVITTTTENPNIPAGNYHIQVKTDGGVILEESYDLPNKAAGTAWAVTSQYINLVDGASANNPKAGTSSLAGGLLDAASIADANWQTALDRFPLDLGPGIVCGPGRTTTAGQVQLAKHAEAKTRVAFLDGPNTPTVATLKAAPAGVIDVSGKRSRYSGMFAPWVVIPGLTVSSTRTVPPSPAVAGKFARNVSFGLSPNEPAAGDNGIFNSVLSVTQTYIDSDRQALNDAGVDIIRDQYGVRKVYGWRTCADPLNDRKWINLGNSILHRAIAAQAGAVGEGYVFKQIDGQNRLINDFGATLVGEVCLPLFLSGSLYGATPTDAYSVDVGPSVNTPTTIANNELHAVISVRMAPFGEEVDIEIVKYLVTETIPA